MILIMVMQEFDRKLSEISNLISQMENDFYHFEREALRLVLELEKMSEKYGLPIQKELALVRGNLVCGYSSEKAALLSRKERGKEKQRYVVQQLTEAVEHIEGYFSESRKQFERCEQVCGQIIVGAYYKGLYKQQQDLFLLAAQEEELAPHMAEIQGMVGCANARVIFEQAKAYIRYETKS